MNRPTLHVAKICFTNGYAADAARCTETPKATETTLACLAMFSPQRDDLAGGHVASWASRSPASPEFDDEREWCSVARRVAAKSRGSPASDSERRGSALFLAPSSPDDDFPGQKAWERVALLQWMRDGGIESHIGSLRHVGIKRVEDLRHGDPDTIVRTLGLTPTKADLFLARTAAAPATVVDEAADAGWLVGSPCGASGFARGGAQLSGFDQPCFDDDDGDDALADASELMLQAAVGGELANLEQLTRVRGIDLNHSREDETTALMFAAMKGHRDCVELLLTAGAEIDRAVQAPQVCVSGWTAFHYAAESDRTNCAVALLHAGATHELKQSSRSDQPATPPEMSSAVRAAIADCELQQRRCRARQRLAFARGGSSGAGPGCALLLLSPDLVEECCAHIHKREVSTPFARRVQAAALAPRR